MIYENTVIGFLLKRPKAVNDVINILNPKYFDNKILKVFYNVITRYYYKKEKMTFSVLDQMLRKRKYKQEFYDTYRELLKYTKRDSGEFKYAVKQVIINYKKRKMIDGVATVTQSLLSDNVIKAQKKLKKISEVIELAKLESDGITMDIRENTDDSKLFYDEAERILKTKDSTSGRIFTGINFLDAITGGGAKGELWIWGGFTGEGKTHMAKEIGYRICTEEKKNVFFASLEMNINEIKYIMETRHSHRFVPGGLLTKRVELGTLTPEEKIIYHKTLNDWANNRKYGKFITWSPPYGCTIDQLAAKIEQVNYEHGIDVVIIDYAELLKLTKNYTADYRIIVKNKIEMIKDVARTFDNNKGIWTFTPHQISRDGRSKAEKRGHYILGDFAESAAIERTANLVGWSLITEDLAEEGKMRIGISKYRMGKKDIRGRELMADFSHALIDEIEDYTNIEDFDL